MILCKLKLTLHGNDNKFLKQLELSSCEPLLYFNATTLKGFIDVNQDLEILLKYDNLNNASQFICHKIHKYLSSILIIYIYIYIKLFTYIYIQSNLGHLYIRCCLESSLLVQKIKHASFWYRVEHLFVGINVRRTMFKEFVLYRVFNLSLLISVNIVNYAKNSQENYKRGGGCGIRYIIP